VYVIRT